MGFEYPPGLCLVHVTCRLIFEPSKGAFPATCPSARWAELSLSAFSWAREKIQGFAELGEAGHQGKKTIPSPAGHDMEGLSSRGAQERGQEQLSWPGPSRQQWSKTRESCYST